MIARFVRLADMLYAEITGKVEFLWAPNGVEVPDERCDCGDRGPDDPRNVIHEMPAQGLWCLLERAAAKARNGSGAEEAATEVMAELELEHTEAMGDE